MNSMPHVLLLFAFFVVATISSCGRFATSHYSYLETEVQTSGEGDQFGKSDGTNATGSNENGKRGKTKTPEDLDRVVLEQSSQFKPKNEAELDESGNTVLTSTASVPPDATSTTSSALTNQLQPAGGTVLSTDLGAGGKAQQWITLRSTVYLTQGTKIVIEGFTNDTEFARIDALVFTAVP